MPSWALMKRPRSNPFILQKKNCLLTLIILAFRHNVESGPLWALCL